MCGWMAGILVWLGRFYTGFTFSSHGYSNGSCVTSVKFHWPVFTLVLSLTQWTCFQLGITYASNGWVSQSFFEANHLKRYQIWRQFSYVFVHETEEHLYSVLTDQLFIGCCLEIVNGWKPVFLVYVDGAIVSDLVDCFAGSGNKGCGASGAVTGLYAAYLATVILNWKEVSAATIRFTYLYLSLVCTFTAPYWYPILVGSNMSYASDIGGAIGGLVFGICRVKIFRKRQWKTNLRKYSFCVSHTILYVVLYSLFGYPFICWIFQT